jgi:hypothetical protein
MKRLLNIIFLGLLLLSHSYSGDKSWFKSFKGIIGSSTVTMNILNYNGEIRGFYYYDKYSVPMNVLGNFKNDSLSLVAYLNSYDSENFKGILKNGNYTGQWSADTNKTAAFQFKDNTSVSEQFEYVFVYGKKELFEGMEYPPAATYTEGSVWPGDEYEHSAFLRKQILKEKRFPQNLQAIGGRMLENKKAFIKDFLEMNKDLTRDEGMDGWSYSREEQDLITIAYMDRNILVLSRMLYSYTGGAHGIYGSGYICLDLNGQNVIKLNDVLTSQGISKLPGLLEKNYRLQNDIDPKQTLQEAGLFEDTINANDNFLLTPGALIFNYTPYEIAPYAAGEVMIYIPISELEAYLKPEIKKILK